MKTKIDRILKIHELVRELSGLDSAQKFIWTRATRLRLAGILRKTSPIYNEYVEQKNQLIAQLGATNEKGIPFIDRANPNFGKFTEENKRMLEVEESLEFTPLGAADVLGPEQTPNHIPIEFIQELIDFGIIVES